MVLLDTCALIWWTLDPNELSKPAARACNDIHEKGGVISSISIWEIGISLEEYVSRLKRLTRFEIVPVDEDIWISSINLGWFHKYPADRVIVATATQRDISIVSKDTIIKDFYSKVIW